MPTDSGAEHELISTDDAPAASRQHADGASDAQDSTARIPVDLVGGLFLLAVVAVFVLNAGDDMLDWVFPLTLSWSLAVVGAYLTIRGLLGFGDKVDTLLPVLRGRGVDVFVFSLLTALYVGLARVVGFWIMSIVMLFAGAVYLDEARTKKRVAVAGFVAIAVCIVAYLLLRRVFYVPLPRAKWLPF